MSKQKRNEEIERIRAIISKISDTELKEQLRFEARGFGGEDGRKLLGTFLIIAGVLTCFLIVPIIFIVIGIKLIKLSKNELSTSVVIGILEDELRKRGYKIKYHYRNGRIKSVDIVKKLF